MDPSSYVHIISENLLHLKNLYPISSVLYAKTVSKMKNVSWNKFFQLMSTFWEIYEICNQLALFRSLIG